VGFWDRLIVRQKVTASGPPSITQVARSTGGDQPATWTSRPDLWPADADVGLRVINYVFKRMQIDEDWSVREARGFTWWGHTLAQRVWAETPRLDDDMTITKLHVETGFVKNVDAHSATEAVVSAINTHATLSAAIWDPVRRRVSFHCTMFVHEENVDWVEELFTHAVALQTADAHSLASGIADPLNGEVDETNHPTSGPRPQADEMLGAMNNYFFTQAPSPYGGQDLVTTLRLLEQRFLANGDEEELVAEFPCTEDKPAIMRAALGLRGVGTALFRAYTTPRHPRLGSGALLLLELPIGGDVALANRLNEAERDEWTSSHLLGGWCVGPAGNESSALMFASFLPAKVRTPSVLINCALNMGLRAKWAGEFLARSSS